MLKFVLPKGSLERATLELFEAADLRVTRGSDRDYRATVDDPRIDSLMFLRPQEIPTYVEDGFFDVGVTGDGVGVDQWHGVHVYGGRDEYVGLQCGVAAVGVIHTGDGGGCTDGGGGHLW